MNGLLCLLFGALSGGGFVLAGVVRPGVILHAFSYGWGWDPRLWLFFAGAFALALPLNALVRSRGVTRDGAPIPVPARRPVDARMVAGAVLFGVGWGLSGACPGPSVAALGSGTLRTSVFAAALCLGFALARLIVLERSEKQARTSFSS